MAFHGSVPGAGIIAVTTPATQSAGVSYTYSGTYIGVPPSALDFRFDAASYGAASSPTIGGGAWSFTTTAPSAGSHTLSVRDHNNTSVVGVSGSFSTANAAITVDTPSTQVAGQTYTYTGTYAGAQPTALDSEFDSAGYTLVSSPTIGGGVFSFSGTAPSAGSHTLSVRDHNVTTTSGTSGSFSTVAGTITVGTPDISQAAANNYTYSGRYTGSAPSALDYQFDSAGYVAAVSPTIGGGFWSFIAAAPSAGSHTISVRNHTTTAIFGTSGTFSTVTATVVNIHNAPAWSAATFTAGQRVTNASKAYQVVNPGTSTSAPTGTGTSINNGGVAAFNFLSGVDFTSINGWASANAGATLTTPVVLQHWNDIPGTPYVGPPKGGAPSYHYGQTVTGIKTTGTSGITITAAAGEGAFDNASRVSHKLQGNSNYGVMLYANWQYAPTLYINTAYFAVTNMQITNGGTTNGCQGIKFESKQAVITRNSIMDDGLHDAGPLGLVGSYGGVFCSLTLTNNIFPSCPVQALVAHPAGRGLIFNGIDGSSVITNNTFIIPSNYGTVGGGTGGGFFIGGPSTGNTITMRSDAFFGMVNDLGYTPYGAGQIIGTPDGHMATDQANFGISGTGITTGNQINVTLSTATFNQPSNTGNGLDLRLPNGSALIGAGSTASPPKIDILGFPRPSPPSIGAHDP